MAKQTTRQILDILWGQGFFSCERTFNAIKLEFSRLGSNPTDASLGMALGRADFLTKRGKRRDFRHIQKFAPKHISLTADVLPNDLILALAKDFDPEIHDLRLNYGNSGTCTSFLLRKILEKLIFLTFAKNGLAQHLEDKTKTGGLVGLSSMLNLAVTTKTHGTPFLMPKTAREIAGIKFLGDTSAHNPLVNVSMKTIIPVMPFIVTAFEELAKKL
jgi:hypothetical protein